MYIRKGWGFTVGQDFYRAPRDMPITLAESEYAKPGNVIGYVDGLPDSSCGFMRADRVRVHVTRQALAE